MHTRNRRNGRLINVQALIPTLWARNSKRSQHAPPVRVVRERAHRHGPCARSSDLSLEASEALSEDDLEVHFRSMKRNDVLRLPHSQDVEQTDKVVVEVSVGSHNAGDEGDVLLVVRAIVLAFMSFMSFIVPACASVISL